MAEEQVNQTMEDAQPEKVETIDKTKYEEVSNDMHKFKKRARELEAQIEQSKLESMKKNQEWEKIAQLKEVEASEAKLKADKLENAYLTDRKFQAVREAALQAGIRKEAMDDLDLVDLNQVVIETTSEGRVNVLGADRFVTGLKAKKPHWFSSQQKPNVNTQNPSVNIEGNVTAAQVLEAQKKGDPQYPQLVRKLQEQRTRKH